MTPQAAAPPQPAQGTVLHRKSVDKLGPQQLAQLRDAYRETMKLKDQNGFWYFAGWHGQPFEWCKHHELLFLPWHRAYLYYLELAMQSKVPGVTLPWWDWTTSASLPAAYTAEEAEGEPNPLLGHTYLIYGSDQFREAPPRHPGAATKTRPPIVPPLPYNSRWDRAMKATSFVEFHERIEEIHNDVHVWVGGLMETTARAAYDPIFFAHHTMVDRAWRLWQHQNPGALPPQFLLDQPLQPNGMTVRQTLDVRHLGYEYAGTAAHVTGNAG